MTQKQYIRLASIFKRRIANANKVGRGYVLGKSYFEICRDALHEMEKKGVILEIPKGQKRGWWVK